jgi:succinate dehydrogenase / fumarate reductase membrane anchor subunit
MRTDGAAHSGLGEWLLQRATSLYLAGFVFYVIAYLTLNPIPDFAAWRTWLTQGPARLAGTLFFVCLLLHAWTGLRSITLDYLRPLWLRVGVTLVTALTLFALALWSVEILWRVGA